MRQGVFSDRDGEAPVRHRRCKWAQSCPVASLGVGASRLTPPGPLWPLGGSQVPCHGSSFRSTATCSTFAEPAGIAKREGKSSLGASQPLLLLRESGRSPPSWIYSTQLFPRRAPTMPGCHHVALPSARDARSYASCGVLYLLFALHVRWQPRRHVT